MEEKPEIIPSQGNALHTKQAPLKQHPATFLYRKAIPKSKMHSNDSRGKLGIVSCESGRHFSEKVIERLKEIIAKENNGNNIDISTKETFFANTEVKTELGESIRNKDIYIFQDTENKSQGLSVNDNYMALKTAILAAKNSGAKHVTAVIPVFPYARQDKPKTREGINASMIARELEDIGVSTIITLDVHNDAIGGFFRRAILENLRASKDFMDYIKENIGVENLVIVAPDVGSAQRAGHYARKLGVKLAIVHKERDYTTKSKVDRMTLVGDVKGKKAFIVDDLMDTAGTAVEAMKTLRAEGAEKVYFAVSLPLLNGPAVEKLNKAHKEGVFNKILGTNVIYREPGFKDKNTWYEEVNLEKYFARVIYNINKGISISRLLE